VLEFTFMRRKFRSTASLFPIVVLLFLGSGQAQDIVHDVWVIPIEGDINPATAEFVNSRILRANRERPLAIALLLNTNGGQLAAMQRIVDAIMNTSEIPTIAVVEKALSAGALIAMSTEHLAMLPGSSIGAALPIIPTFTGARAVGEKFNSAFRGQFRSIAEARGRNTRVAEAMVDEKIEIPGLSTSEELVTLTALQAVEFGIADLEARTLREAISSFGYGGVILTRFEPNLTERIGAFFAKPILAAILLAIGIGGILIEIFTPGFGAPGVLGVLALALLGVGAFVATPANTMDLILIVVGVLFVALEALVIPGFGVAGLLGITAIVTAVFRIFQNDAVAVVSLAAIFGGTILALAFWLLPNTRIGHGLMLRTRLGNASGAPGTPNPKGVKEHLIGQSGQAKSDLRPAGVAYFNGERVDVVTEGDYVPSGSPIKVTLVEGNRVIVRSSQE
jgi:membrane-bound serine protease (ClpP class)